MPWHGTFLQKAGFLNGEGREGLLKLSPPSSASQALLEEKAPRFPFTGAPKIWALTQSPESRRQVCGAAEPSATGPQARRSAPGQAGCLEHKL